MKTLYVSRPVVNADALVAWAKLVGFPTTLPADEMHVTVCYSKTPLDWPVPLTNQVEAQPGGRMVSQFGDNAVVLQIRSADLSNRAAMLAELGATSDHDEFRPHITITYDAAGVDLSKVEPFAGTILLGPEIFAEIDSSWKENLVEKEFAIEGTVEKYTEEKGQAFGIFTVVKVGDSLVVDHEDGDRIQPDEIEKAQYDYVMNARAADVNHDESKVADLIESMVFTPEKCELIQKALRRQGIDATINIPAVVVWGGHQINDESVKKRVKSGELRSYSMGGTGKRTPVKG